MGYKKLDWREEARLRREERERKLDEWEPIVEFHAPSGASGPRERNWVVKDFLPRGYLMLFAGPDKLGKTAFLDALMLAVAKGEPFLGQETIQGTVFWCAQEECRGERLDILEQDEAFRMETLPIVTAWGAPPIDTDDGIMFLEHWVSRVNAKLVVIDTLYAATSGRNLAHGHSARRAMNNLKRFAAIQGVAVIVVHHTQQSRQERIADSIQLRAASSINVTYHRHTRVDGTGVVTLLSRGRGEFANRSYLIKTDGPLKYELLEEPEEEPREPETPKVNAREQAVLEVLKRGPQTSTEIAARTDIGLQSLRNLLVKMQDARTVTKRYREGKWQFLAMTPLPLPNPPNNEPNNLPITDPSLATA